MGKKGLELELMMQETDEHPESIQDLKDEDCISRGNMMTASEIEMLQTMAREKKMNGRQIRGIRMMVKSKALEMLNLPQDFFEVSDTTDQKQGIDESTLAKMTPAQRSAFLKNKEYQQGQRGKAFFILPDDERAKILEKFGVRKK